MPRNLLLVLADQMRADVAGYAGGQADTPHLDALAARGVQFDRCLSTTPVCGPSRASLLTGTEPLTHTVVGNDLALPDSATTIGDVAHAAGYRCAYVGKWHLDGVPRDRFTPPGPRRHGFEFWRAYNCSHAYLAPRYFADTPELIEPVGYEPVVQTDLMLEFLHGLAPDDNFLGVLSWGPPHDPYDQVPEQYRERYDPSVVGLPSDATGPGGFAPPEPELRRIVADYLAAVTALDEQLGRLLDGLEQLGRAEDTVVVFTADHGDLLGAHGYLKKQLPYDEAVRVPLIIDGSGAAAARTDALVPTVDLAPTLLSLIGLPVPDTMTGLDRSAELTVSAPAARQQVLLANYTVFDEGRRQGIPEWRALRTERHTYAEALGRRPWLLFDDIADPAQRTNLLDDPSTAGVVDRLSTELHRRLDAEGDPFGDTEAIAAHVGVAEAWAERQTYTF